MKYQAEYCLFESFCEVTFYNLWTYYQIHEPF